MRTYYLTVTGMTGGACRDRVVEALGSLPGVGAVRVSPINGSVTIHCNEHYVSAGVLESAIEEAGFGVDSAGPAHTQPARAGREAASAVRSSNATRR